MTSGTSLFIVMVFVTVILLMQGLVVPAFGESAKARKKLRKRIADIEAANEEEALSSLLRAKYLRTLSPLERRLESLPILFLGTSGAVLGLVAALAVVSSSRLLRLAVLGIALHYAVSRSAAVAVQNLPHFFGLLAGFVYALVFRVSDRKVT